MPALLASLGSGETQTTDWQHFQTQIFMQMKTVKFYLSPSNGSWIRVIPFDSLYQDPDSALSSHLTHGPRDPLTYLWGLSIATSSYFLLKLSNNLLLNRQLTLKKRTLQWVWKRASSLSHSDGARRQDNAALVINVPVKVKCELVPLLNNKTGRAPQDIVLIKWFVCSTNVFLNEVKERRLVKLSSAATWGIINGKLFSTLK